MGERPVPGATCGQYSTVRRWPLHLRLHREDGEKHDHPLGIVEGASARPVPRGLREAGRYEEPAEVAAGIANPPGIEFGCLLLVCGHGCEGLGTHPLPGSILPFLASISDGNSAHPHLFKYVIVNCKTVANDTHRRYGIWI